MSKQSVPQDKFLELLNELLRQQADYVGGMAFVPSPPGVNGAVGWGYDCTTPFSESGAYIAALKIANEMYEVVPRRS